MGSRREKSVRQEKIENDILRRYPKLDLINTECAPERFVQEVKKAYRKTILEIGSGKATGRAEILRELMKSVVKFGSNTVSGMGMKPLMEWCSESGVLKSSTHVSKDAESFSSEGGNKKLRKFLITLTHARNELLSLLSERVEFDKWMPDNFISCGMFRDGWYVKFHRSERVSTDGGKIYRHDKSIEVDGQRYELWLSKHAMERVVGRVCKDPDVGIAVLGEFMSHAIFQFAGFGKFQHLLVCYMPTPYRSMSDIYTKDDLDIPVVPGHRGEEPVMRYLYFPFSVDGNRIILKSALLPGFHGTPEFAAKEDIVTSRARGTVPGLSEKDWAEVRRRTVEFYDRDNDTQMVMSNYYMTIAIVFNLLGHPQFYLGDFELFPVAATSPQELGLPN